MEQLEDGHQLLELEHCLLQIRLQHVAEGGYAGGARVGLASDDLCGSSVPGFRFRLKSI